MAQTRRDLFSKSAIAVGVLSAGLTIATPSLSQEPCDQSDCNPFPTGGSKSEMSREEFNKLAEGLAENVEKGLRGAEGVEISDEELKSIIDESIKDLEDTLAKYYNFY